ncbi:MAG: leucine--tRNA ligase [Alistipes sp.]|nr:leucine--tRNA ligase [Alistipes sp.]
MDYDFKEIEPRQQQKWRHRETYKVAIDPARPKYYVLDMFPYPSGAGLHVGHPLGYIASDIYTRYKRLCGFNVLHPMGFDAFGLPAEQYAIQTGQHPAKTTADNIARYREQLDKLGFSFDWDRCVETSDPAYYKWTQWAFVRMFESYYCQDSNQARPISELEEAFPIYGNEGLNAACTTELSFTAAEWNAMNAHQKQDVLMNYRLAYRASTMVNWCEALGTVLANDEVKDGLSERGGHPVEQRRMQQWLLRVSAYAERLLSGLDTLQWSESLKEIQRGWIGKSTGAQLFFDVVGSDKKLEVFTTRPDTIHGVTFMVLAPEHAWVGELTTPEQRTEVDAYIAATKKRSERERIADTKKVTGVFTGSHATNPFTGESIPIYISDYVLAGYGTGAIMAVPAHDSRDWAFARRFDLPITPVVEGGNVAEASYDAKSGRMINSGIIDGLDVKDAIVRMFDEIERRGLGKLKVNYRLRDAIFSRQRYWGEPIPIYYKDGIATAMPQEKLPLELPPVSDFSPSPTGEPPLARVKDWTYEGHPLETSTMPGFAGSSAYYLRYMDPHNADALVSKEADEYWRDVDLYVGGIEHATGHLIYSRFWDKFLFDLGVVSDQEPFKKLVNQGMIQGRSNFVYRIPETNKFISINKKTDAETRIFAVQNSCLNSDVDLDAIEEILAENGMDLSWFRRNDGFYPFDDLDIIYNPDDPENPIIRPRPIFTKIHVDVNIVKNDILDTEAFKKWRPEFADAEFVLEDEKYVCGWAVEKMSKSMFNVVNPDEMVERYGADTLRMYEMFLGPLEQSKPWDTNGIDGVHKFLRRFWNLFQGDISDEQPTPEELKTLHKTIKKVREDIENFSFNTSVAAFMICLNELGKCDKRQILEPLTILLAPFAPHIAEELWERTGHTATIFDEAMPEHNPAYLVEAEFEYPVSVNGKTRFKKTLPLTLTIPEIEAAVLADENAQRWLEGKTPRKMVVVPGKIVNIVV